MGKRKIRLNKRYVANLKQKCENTIKERIERKLIVQLNNLNFILNKKNVLDLAELMENTIKFLFRNFTSGIIKGIGFGIGFSIITALIIYLLQNIIKLNIPVISEYISDIVEIVQNTKK